MCVLGAGDTEYSTLTCVICSSFRQVRAHELVTMLAVAAAGCLALKCVVPSNTADIVVSETCLCRDSWREVISLSRLLLVTHLESPPFLQVFT